MRKWNYVSELVDVRNLKKDKLNLIVSGTGTGKSKWALENLMEDLHNEGIEVDPHEIYFVSSRLLTVEQQKEKYGCVKYNRGIHSFEDGGFIGAGVTTKIRVMCYSTFANIIENGEMFAKYVVLDEIHAVISDSSYQGCMKTVKNFIMMNKETVKIGMTATDILVTENNLNVNINRLIEGVNNKFEVEEELILTYQRNLHLLLNESKGKSIVMVNTIHQGRVLQEKLTKNSMLLCSKSNKEHFTDEMLNVYNYIKNNECFPDDIDVLICTTCAREGVEFQQGSKGMESDFAIENVAVYGADAINIIQFVGRYRGNVKKLILVNDFFRATGVKTLDNTFEKMSKEYWDMYSLMSRDWAKMSNYFRYIKHIVSRDIKISRFASDEAFMLFLQWFNENWTERLIYTKEHKKEIADKALEFGVRKVDRKKHTFQSLIKMIEERSQELIFLNNGKLLRKNNELVEKYKKLDVIESDRISPYIVVNTDKHKSHRE